jgi:hypothetical protein
MIPARQIAQECLLSPEKERGRQEGWHFHERRAFRKIDSFFVPDEANVIWEYWRLPSFICDE